VICCENEGYVNLKQQSFKDCKLLLKGLRPGFHAAPCDVRWKPECIIPEPGTKAI